MADPSGSQRLVLDKIDLETELIAGAFRPDRKRFVIAGLANLVLASLLLGLPYLRGRRLANRAPRP
jgi:hypothetical protein